MEDPAAPRETAEGADPAGPRVDAPSGGPMEGVVITTPQEDGRWRRAVGVLAELSLDLDLARADAVYLDSDSYRPPPLVGLSLTLNECGCLRAHRAVWQSYLDAPGGEKAPLLVFEDDICLAAAPAAEIAAEVRRVYEAVATGEADLGYLGYAWLRRFPVTTHAYVLSPRAARTFLEHISPACGQFWVVDWQTAFLSSTKLRTVFAHDAPRPPEALRRYRGVIHQDDTLASDIQPARARRWASLAALAVLVLVLCVGLALVLAGLSRGRPPPPRAGRWPAGAGA